MFKGYKRFFSAVITILVSFNLVISPTYFDTAYANTALKKDKLAPPIMLGEQGAGRRNGARKTLSTAPGPAIGGSITWQQMDAYLDKGDFSHAKAQLEDAIELLKTGKETDLNNVLAVLIGSINRDFRRIYVIMKAVGELADDKQQALERYILSQPDLKNTPLAHRIVDCKALAEAIEKTKAGYLVQRADVPEELSTLDTVGGKVHNLFKMVRYFLTEIVAKRLLRMGLDKPPVPSVFGITGAGHNFFLRLNTVENESMLKKIREVIIDLDAQDAYEPSIAEGLISGWHQSATVPESLADELFAEFLLLAVQEGIITKDKIEKLMELKNSQEEIKVKDFFEGAKEGKILNEEEVTNLIGLLMAVRSSSYYEDRPIGAAAGLQDTYLNVTFEALFANVLKGFASLWKSMPIVYRDLLVFDEWLTQSIDKRDLQTVITILEKRYNSAYDRWVRENIADLVNKVEAKHNTTFEIWKTQQKETDGISEIDLKRRFVETLDRDLVINAFESDEANSNITWIEIKEGKTASTRDVILRLNKAIKDQGERKEQFVSTYRLLKILSLIEQEAPVEVSRLRKSLTDIRSRIVDPLNVGMGLGVQAMRQSKFCITGFTVKKASKMTGFSNNTLTITFDATYGLGPFLVEGKVEPDRLEVYIDLKTGKAVVNFKHRGKKERMMTKEHPEGIEVPQEMRERFCITESLYESDIEQKAIEIARWIVEIQGALGKTVDTECLYYEYKGRLRFNTVQMRAVAIPDLDKDDPKNLRLKRTIPDPEQIEHAKKFGEGVATSNAGAGRAIYIDEKSKRDVAEALTQSVGRKLQEGIAILKALLPGRYSEPFKDFENVKKALDKEWFTDEELKDIIWRYKRAKRIKEIELEKDFADLGDINKEDFEKILSFIGREDLVGVSASQIDRAIEELTLPDKVQNKEGFKRGLKNLLTELSLPVEGELSPEAKRQVSQDRQSLLLTIFIDIRTNIDISNHLFTSEVNVFVSEILSRQIDRFIEVVDLLKNAGETVGMLAADPKPEYDRAMMVASYVVTLTGSETSHATIFCGERGIPAVVGLVINPALLSEDKDILNKVKKSEIELTVDANQGRIYLGKYPIIEEIIFYSPTRWQHFKTKVGLILASVLDAERVSKLSLWAPKFIKELKKKLSGYYGFSLDRIEEALLAIGVDFRAGEAYDNLQILNNKEKILARLKELEGLEAELITAKEELEGALNIILDKTELGPSKIEINGEWLEVPREERREWIIANVEDLLDNEETIRNFAVSEGGEVVGPVEYTMGLLRGIKLHKNNRIREQLWELAILRANKKQLYLLENPQGPAEIARQKRMMADVEKLRPRKDIQAKIREKIAGYPTAEAYLRDKLKAHFIGLARTVTPEQLVLVRARDFKKNEIIKDLIGAELFYNEERASMVGDRGTGLEVRDENIYAVDIQLKAMNDAIKATKGTNVGTFGFFFVFLRSPEDLEKGLDRIAKLYEAGEIELPPYIGMMLELGNNVPLAADYARILANFARKYNVHTFFSYGTNDLTQSVKKADRDEKGFKKTKIYIPGTDKVSEISVFDEGDPEVIDAILHSALEAKRVIEEEFTDPKTGEALVDFTLGLCGNAIINLLRKPTPEARRAAMQIVAVLDSVGTSIPAFGQTVSLTADSHLETNYIDSKDVGPLTKIVTGKKLREEQKGAALRRVVFIKNNRDLTYLEKLPDGKKVEVPKIVEGDIVILGPDVDFTETDAKKESILAIQLSKASGIITSGVREDSPVMEWLRVNWRKPAILVDTAQDPFRALEDNRDYVVDFQRGFVYLEKSIKLYTEKIVDNTIFTPENIDYTAEPEKVNVKVVSMDDIFVELGLHPFAFAIYLYKTGQLSGLAKETFEEAYNDLRAFQKEKGIVIDEAVERDTVRAVEELLGRYEASSIQDFINKVVKEHIDAAVREATEKGELVVFETSQQEPDFFKGSTVGGQVLLKGLKFGDRYERSTTNSPLGFRGLIKNMSPGYNEVFIMFLRATKKSINEHGRDKVAIQLNMAHNPKILKSAIEFLEQAGFELGEGKDQIGFSISSIGNYIRIYDYLMEYAKKKIISFCRIDDEQLGQDHLMVDLLNMVELYDGKKIPLFSEEQMMRILKKPVAITKTAMKKMNMKLAI